MKTLMAVSFVAVLIVSASAAGLRLDIPLGLIEPDIPLNAPLTAAKIALGREIFFDESLSMSGNTSCATCHDPRHGFAEGRPRSVGDGGRSQERNAPSLLNAGYLTTVMWDGRFDTLEEQATDPFRRDGDMGLPLDVALERLNESPRYQQLFRAAFQRPPDVDGLRSALSAFQRSLVSGGSRFDRYFFNDEMAAFSRIEIDGFEVFLSAGSCINCHDIFHRKVNPLGGGIALFTDFRFHNLGVGYENGRMRDVGRFYETRRAEDWGAFKTPSLRNVSLTAPYMHDGSLATLEEVVELYDRGGTQNPNISPTLRPLFLSQYEKEALIAFLRSLTDPKLDQPTPSSQLFETNGSEGDS